MIAVSTGQGTLTFEGVCEGVITTSEHGDKGFGYDPIFRPDGFSETFAEMDSETKNRISHRGRALQVFARWLEEHRDQLT